MHAMHPVFLDLNDVQSSRRRIIALVSFKLNALSSEQIKIFPVVLDL